MHLSEWFQNARPGESMVYYTGELSRDRVTLHGDVNDRDAAGLALSLGEKFLAHLFQRRVSGHVFEYTIVKASPEYAERMRKLWGKG